MDSTISLWKHEYMAFMHSDNNVPGNPVVFRIDTGGHHISFFLDDSPVSLDDVERAMRKYLGDSIPHPAMRDSSVD